MLLAALTAVSLLIWIYILLGRGGFWRLPNHRMTSFPPVESRRVVIVIPARNESEVIAQSLESLFHQTYRSIVRIIVVDDNSDDQTPAIASETALQSGQSHRLTVLLGKPLVEGWTGKLWALAQGIEHANRLTPDYLLLTDADIVHSQDNVKTLVSIAEATGSELTSFMVKLACLSSAEKALIPAFVFFFLQLYPPAWIASQKFKTAAAAGGCILIRPETLSRIGGLASIRGAVIDDCALARAVKGIGGRIWLGLTPETRSIRSYDSLAEIGNMISRTAYSQLNHSATLLGATLLGLAITYVVPIVALFSAKPLTFALGISAWCLMTVSYLPMVRFYVLSPTWSLILPATALFYSAATVRSAVRYWIGKGGEWKSRAQDTRF